MKAAVGGRGSERQLSPHNFPTSRGSLTGESLAGLTMDHFLMPSLSAAQPITKPENVLVGSTVIYRASSCPSLSK
ncbi:hypothetical protein E2C01_101919 [Portunus trituberculatus]|uniref:Uncharacterized protein n=1 Tax=Portunus trituberculatus TaxID=210409 RepID=A0A5B7KLI3_PORTR|nr:hypothetical protein [Portunus trituberculatus]